MVITIIPVSIGMYLKYKKPNWAAKAERPVKLSSTFFIILILIILGAVLKDKENIIPAFKEMGLPILILNTITLLVGFYSSRLLKLSFKQASTISIESGIQNGTLAIAIATSGTMLNNPEMAIPPAVYSLLMFVTGALAVRIFQKKNSTV